MQIQIILFCIMLSSGFSAFAQQIPVGSCGNINVYDAAGNRTKRTYFCNNGSYPYPQGKKVNNEIIEFQEVDALYPNPTTGLFYISFSKALENATVAILDASGKMVRQSNAVGARFEFDLSGQPAGVYYVRIVENGQLIIKKVVKR